MNLRNTFRAVAESFVRRLPIGDSRQVTRTETKRRAKWPGLLLRVLLTIVVIALLFWQIPWQGVFSAAAGMKRQLLILAILLSVPNHVFQFLRWALLVKHAGKEATWPEIFRSYFVGFSLGIVTPGRVGQFARCFALKLPVTRSVGASLLERLYATVALDSAGPLAFGAMILAGHYFPSGLWRIPLLIVLGAIGVGMLLVGLFPTVLLPLLSWLVRQLPLREKLEQVVDVLAGMKWGQALELSLLSFAAMGVACLQFVVLLHSMDAVFPLGWGLTAVMANFFFKANLPFSIAGLGIGEWTAILCLAGIGVAAASAVASSLVLFAINVLAPALLGIPFVPALKLRRADTMATPLPRTV
jgi:uncharacterized membrane protein YbhN (UPF0104 family)